MENPSAKGRLRELHDAQILAFAENQGNLDGAALARPPIPFNQKVQDRALETKWVLLATGSICGGRGRLLFG
ncbi:hypothetical protein [Paracoccus acridae]|uniref:hypothetical protein n=1 Tax=Paracoccus acridae TaxID=1795310 RepID=UPI001665A46B|nr:hypothetical protein [Paracoccus acridae]